MIIASPSNDPPYKFHWIRDASLVMRVIIDYYKREELSSTFVFNNPNETERCGCGESFKIT